MKHPSRINFSLLFALFSIAGCDGLKRGPTPPANDEAIKPLRSLQAVSVAEGRDGAGAITFRVGRIEGVLPSGWSAMQVGPQVLYHSPNLQESLHLFGYASDAPLDGARQAEVIAAMNEVGGRAERMLGVIGSGPSVEPPKTGHPAWGTTSAFVAAGPLNRVSFHYAAVAAHEALMFQLDGNTETDAPADATALVRSIEFRDAPASHADTPLRPSDQPAAARMPIPQKSAGK